MKTLLRRYGPALGVGAAFLLLFALLLPSLLSRDLTRDHSAFRKNVWGCAALAELCRRAEPPLRVDVLTQPLDDLDDLSGPLLVIDPERPFASSELDAIVSWVESGGTLIAALEGPWDDPTTLAVRGQTPSMALASALGLAMVEGPATLEQAQPAPRADLGEGVERVAIRSRYTLQAASGPARGEDRRLRLAPDDLRPQLLADGRPVLASFRHGRGEVFVSSDAAMFANSTLPREDNLQLMANLLWPRAEGGAIAFDEYHHGFGARAGDGPGPDPAPLNRALLVAAAGLALFLIGRAQRFGAPVRAFDPRRRAAMEYVEALAGLLARGEANRWALEKIGATFRHRLSAAAGRPTTVDDDTLAAALAERCGLPRETTVRLLADLDDALSRANPGSHRLLALTRHLSDLEERLGAPARRRRAREDAQ